MIGDHLHLTHGGMVWLSVGVETSRAEARDRNGTWYMYVLHIGPCGRLPWAHEIVFPFMILG